MLKIENLDVKIDDKIILKDFALTINEGEIHAVMGKNGAGKSTLSKVIMGDNNYEIIKGNIFFYDEKINLLEPNERANKGIFLASQSPIEIEGVTTADLLKNALQNKGDFKLYPFIKELEETALMLDLKKEMLYRGLNVGFSGGERKKNEVLQMYMLKPKLIILDEIDSGLDVDSLKIVGTKIMEYYEKYKPSILIITHYNRLLDYIKPHFVHVLEEGKIIKTGNANLAEEIEKNGYGKENV